MKLRPYLFLLAIVIGFLPLLPILEKYNSTFDWQTKLQNSNRLGEVRYPGQVVDLSEAPDHSNLSLLSEPGATCNYFRDGVSYKLPSPTRDHRNHSVRYALHRIQPQKEDLSNIKINGASWNWQATVNKDNSEKREVSCDSRFMLVDTPRQGILRTFSILGIASTYFVVLIFAIIKVTPASWRSGGKSNELDPKKQANK